MKIVASIEARMRSTRLPGKVLKPIMNRPMLELIIERLKMSKMLNGIVIATTDHSSCDPIEELADKLEVDCFRGSEEDVIMRVYLAAKHAEADVLVVITGDMPVVDPTIIDQVVQAYFDNDVDYCANSLIQSYPRGLGIQVLDPELLNETSRLTDEPKYHEHATLYVREHPELYSHFNILSPYPQSISNLRMTVDTPEDFEFISKIYESLYPENPSFSLDDILNLIENNTELKTINKHIKQKPVS